MGWFLVCGICGFLCGATFVTLVCFRVAMSFECWFDFIGVSGIVACYLRVRFRFVLVLVVIFIKL